MQSHSTSKPGVPEYDVVFSNARREALVIFCLWVACLLWAVPTCYWLGFHRPTAEPAIVFGMPAWVFYGVVLPWLFADLFTVYFCFGFMTDDDLGEAPEDAVAHASRDTTAAGPGERPEGPA